MNIETKNNPAEGAQWQETVADLPAALQLQSAEIEKVTALVQARQKCGVAGCKERLAAPSS